MTRPAAMSVADAVIRMAPGGSGAAVVAPRRIAWVEGPDAQALLQGLLTADIAALPVGGATESLVLDARGHLLARMSVMRDESEAFTLLLDPPPAPDGVAQVIAHHVSEDAAVMGPEEVHVLVVGGAAIATLRAGNDPVVPGVVPGTVEVITDDPHALAARAGVPLAPPDVLEVLRISAGVPRIGVDTGDKTLVQEAGLEGAVSFDKGCYLGQETVARLHYRGHPNRRLSRIAVAGPVTPGSEVLMDDGTVVGQVTSAIDVPGTGWVALAMVRREAWGTPGVSVSGTPGTLLLPGPRHVRS
ncbi:MAG: folate-binding protein [Thermoleophilia bacterium]|nr:folate-binding protein [Thermoleophilia bacterium]